MKLREIISEEVVKAATGGTFDDLQSPITEPGTVLEVTHIAVENRTTAYTRLTIGVADGDRFLEKEEEDTPSANNIYWSESRFLVPAGKRLQVRLTGCTAGDNIHLVYEGKLYAET